MTAQIYPPYTMAYNFAIQAGQSSSSTDEQGNAIYNDGTYSFVTGKFNGTASFGVCGNKVSAGGGDDIFVAVYDNTGACVDVEIAGGTGTDEGLGITSFSSGGTKYVYVCGYKGSDIYFIKYTFAAGALNFSSDHTVTSSGTDGKARAITNDGTNVYATGYYTTSANFGSGTTRFKQDNCSSNNGTGRDMFLVKYGTGSWSETAFGQIGDSNSDDCEGYAITYASSPAARLYLTGYFKGTVRFVCPSGGTLSTNGSTGRDIFVTSATNGCVFNDDQKRGGGSSAETGGHEYTNDIGYGITSFYASSTSNGIAVTGNIHNSSCTFGTNTINGASNGSCAFFAKYPINSVTGNINGDASWAYSTGYSSGTETYSQGRCASNDGYHFVFGGLARSITTFSGASSTRIDLNGKSSTSSDVGFIVKFDRDGKVVWADEIDQAPASGGAKCFGIFTTSSCVQHITGYFAGSCSFGATPTNLTASGSSDVFVASVKKDNYVIEYCGTPSFSFEIHCDVTNASTYSWVGSPSSSNISPTNTWNPTFTISNCSSTAGTITYTVTTTGGTSAGSRTIIVKSSKAATSTSADAGVDKSNCSGSFTGTIGGSGCNGWTYSWTTCTSSISPCTALNPTVTNLTSTTNYTLTVTDACGATDTDVMTVTVNCSCCCLSEPDDTPIDNPTEVFPNPSGGIFTIMPGEDLPGYFNVVITDIAGRVIYAQSNVANDVPYSVDISDHARGTYLMTMTSGDKKIIYKLSIE